MMEPPTTTEAAEAAILVYWDMKMCPLPDGYDARRVGQFIERKLRQFGYNGPITITAVGILDGVPERALEALLSSGISLYNAPYGTKDVARLALFCLSDFPPPGNLMVISRPPEAAAILDSLSRRGYNTISPFPLAYSHPEDDAKDLWENFLLADTLPLEEDKCTKTGQSWVCGVCDDDIPGRGFQDFITHLSTQKHKLEIPLWHSYEIDEEFGDEEFGDEELGDEELGDEELGDAELGDEELGDEELEDEEFEDKEVEDSVATSGGNQIPCVGSDESDESEDAVEASVEAPLDSYPEIATIRA